MKSIFISWLPHCRRSDSLAAALGGKSHLIHYLGFKKSWQASIKYPLQAIETFRLLYKEKPDLILVATPPVLAAVPVYFYARMRRVPFVIDAHTGVFDDPRWTWLIHLSRGLSRAASATVVTNDHLAGIVTSWGARALIIGTLPVIFPPFQAPISTDNINIVYINTFSRDEPVEAVVTAAKRIPHAHVYITGDLKHASRDLLNAAPSNVHFTGWLSDDEYAKLIRSASLVVVLTTRDHTMQRGAYEAMALEKPLITSNWPILRNIFSRGTIHVDNTVGGIATGIESGLRNHKSLASEMKILRIERNAAFDADLNNLVAIVKNHSHFSARTEHDKESARV